ncbi:MAG TPA: hypothetical protein PLR60_13825 [Syntrophorhabdaceae bacterium]|nr:hypothetical protein [Syntrophorhabdaceae bacterium]
MTHLSGPGPLSRPGTPFLTKEAVRKGEGAEYLSWRYMERLFTSGDTAHPYFTIFSWLDDVDVDVAEMLGIDPSPEVIDAVAERIVRRSVRDRSMHGWELPDGSGTVASHIIPNIHSRAIATIA